jgi:hypothetical protein
MKAALVIMTIFLATACATGRGFRFNGNGSCVGRTVDSSDPFAPGEANFEILNLNFTWDNRGQSTELGQPMISVRIPVIPDKWETFQLTFPKSGWDTNRPFYKFYAEEKKTALGQVILQLATAAGPYSDNSPPFLPVSGMMFILREDSAVHSSETTCSFAFVVHGTVLANISDSPN